jgi:hypothetical protein
MEGRFMHLRYRILTLFAMVGILCVAPLAHAQPKSAPEVDGLPADPPFPEVLIGQPLSPTTVCTLGETRAPAWVVNYLLPPDDGYYTLLSPAQCTSCTGPGGVILTTANVMLEFRTVCSIPVTVRIVGAADAPGGGLCPSPDPNAVICADMSYTLTPPAPGIYTFSLALPAACCITSDAFLVVEFDANGVGCSTNATRPRLVTADGCNSCQSYNIYPGGNDDLCDIVGFPGNPVMNADADCCGITGSHPHSWGSLKTLYR